jgi:hypothetical protein
MTSNVGSSVIEKVGGWSGGRGLWVFALRGKREGGEGVGACGVGSLPCLGRGTEGGEGGSLSVANTGQGRQREGCFFEQFERGTSERLVASTIAARKHCARPLLPDLETEPAGRPLLWLLPAPRRRRVSRGHELRPHQEPGGAGSFWGWPSCLFGELFLGGCSFGGCSCLLVTGLALGFVKHTSHGRIKSCPICPPPTPPTPAA